MSKNKWKKGQSGNPKGRPPVLLPEVQKLIDQNKNEVKTLIIKLLGMTEAELDKRNKDTGISAGEKLFLSCIERINLDGDILKYRMLLEIVLGKLPEEKEEFPISYEERLLVMEYRKRLESNEKPAIEHGKLGSKSGAEE